MQTPHKQWLDGLFNIILLSMI